jgi:L-galactose dehydrogenase
MGKAAEMSAPKMTYARLGRTGMSVSRVGLGAGGPSRLGTKHGASQADVERLIGTAVDLGVTLIDTARGYGTEAAIGAALQSLAIRDIVVATKTVVSPATQPAALTQEIEHSLRDLRREALDIFQFHAVLPQDLDDVVQRLLPVAEKLRQQGKIRHVGITEDPSKDVAQSVAVRAAASGLFDTLMVQYGVFDQGPAQRTLAQARAADVGVFCMSAARGALVHEEMLAGVLKRMDGGTPEDLRHLLDGGTWADLAFRFAAACEDIDVVLVGTGNAAHLCASSRAILAPPLAASHVALLKQRFGATRGDLLWDDEG